MIPAYFTSALANHLWQSTVVAIVAALLAFALRKNHARTRYWLWLIASVKFLIPFSLLIGIGSRLEWPAAAPIARPELSAVMEQITQPFPQSLSSVSVAPVMAQNRSLLPAALLATWICGFLAVAFSWWRRWRRIHAIVRAASPLVMEADLPVLSSPALLEPGVFGIFRPVLLLPAGITDHLAPAHLKAIFAHELCHVRRRDNLAAAIHMLVEAIFWFHPLVWWLGARLVEERERACDEEVLRLGSEPEVYAESILKTCQFYLESPLACMSGITGSDLKERIVRIMTQRLANRLTFGRKLLLAAAGMAAVAGPVVFGLMSASLSRAQSQPAAGAPLPSFEVASVKPNHTGERNIMMRNTPGRFAATNVTVKLLIEMAYQIKSPQISGGPSWIDSERYDIEATTGDSGGADEPRRPPSEEQQQQVRLMLRSLLADRFKLTLDHVTKELPIYVLVVAKNGPKLHESAPMPADMAPPDPGGPPKQPGMRRGVMFGRGELTVNGAPLAMLADSLSRQLGRNVVDKTGLTGNYDFTLKWTPDESQGQMFRGPGDAGEGRPEAAPPSDASGPTIFTALQEQLGLKLESQKGPVDTLVISRIEKPSEN